jgi:hypothetical protein
MEEWRDIEGFPRYNVSNLGRVRSLIGKTKLLNPYLSCNNDYYSVSLFSKGKRHIRLVHRLVLKAFKKNPNPGYFDRCDHINQNKRDNNINNLRWSNAVLNGLNGNQKGFYWRKARNKFEAAIKINGKSIYLGQFKYSYNARKRYLEARKDALNTLDRYHVY